MVLKMANKPQYFGSLTREQFLYYENRIVDYRKNECFHFGNSKKQLLAWIDKYLKER